MQVTQHCTFFCVAPARREQQESPPILRLELEQRCDNQAKSLIHLKYRPTQSEHVATSYLGTEIERQLSRRCTHGQLWCAPAVLPPADSVLRR
jgi:hypothetical protein